MKTIGTLLFTLILSGFYAPRCGATVYHSNGSVASVQALHNVAHDGDTITVPAGTFSWTATLNITKGVTIQGQTTISGAGTAHPVINDRTIIQDNTPRSGTSRTMGILRSDVAAGKSFRFTGMSFVAGHSTALPGIDGAFKISAPSANGPSKLNRIDHCHFGQLYQGKMFGISGWAYGVADHNVIELRRTRTQGFLVIHAIYGGKILGHGSWADYPWYGTDKFWFIENNTITGFDRLPNGLTDGYSGARFVVRYNYIKNCYIGDHGTEGGGRGLRAKEVYNNTFEFPVGGHAGGQRGGTSLWHDNIVTGRDSGLGICGLENFREFPARSTSAWGLADGTSTWDANDTEGNGTFVEGHPPHVFDSGTDNSSVNSKGIIHDSTKNWVPNQWVGYSVTNYNPVYTSDGIGSYITSNTSNTITYVYYSAPDTPQHMIFNAGDPYKIHRVLVAMDQNGRGKTDLITGSGPYINTTTGTASWAHSALEPCYAWNNVYAPNGHALGFLSRKGQPTTKLNVDYFNLGAGFPANTTPLAVSSTYTAALNGVNYTGTFVYPHPLTLLPTGTARAFVADFNGAGRPDYVLQNPNTRQTAIWYLNNNVFVGSAYGPTVPPGWNLVGVADFNRDSHSDYALFAPRTHQTAIWYLSGPRFIRSAYGPTLPSGWELVATADFNGDGKPDYLLYNGGARRTAIWYLNNSVFVRAAWGPTLPTGWSLVGAADFDRNGHIDYLLFNSITRQTAIWYLSGPTFLRSAYGPGVPGGWAVVAAADFNGDGKPDYLLYNLNTQQTAVWYLNNNVFVSGAYGPTLSPGWSFFGP
jgi:hypothetical protein